MAPNAEAIYSHASDEVARLATISLETGTSAATYGVDRLIDDNPAHVFKAVELATAIQFDYAEKQPLALLALIHTTLEADDVVTIQGDDAADWVTPAYEATITPSGWVGAGVTRWPVNTWLDLTETEDYDPLGFLSYRLTFGVGTPLAQALQIGQIRFHPMIRRWPIDRGPLEGRFKPLIDNKTAFEVSTIYTRGTTRWSLKFGLEFLEDDLRAALQAQWSDVDGQAQPWLFIPHGFEPACYEVRWETTEEQIQRALTGTTGRGLARFSGAVREVGRGLRPGV